MNTTTKPERTFSDAVRTLTDQQVAEIAATVSKRFYLKNHGTYYNITDTNTGQQSNQGGDYNFTSLFFHRAIVRAYLIAIDENPPYLHWQQVGVDVSNERQAYLFALDRQVVRLLCGFDNF